MLHRRRVLATGAALAAAAAIGPARAQAFPSRAITVVVPFTPGGGTDIGARRLAEALAAHVGQSVIVANRPGANGVVAGQATLRAEPDGYTVLVATAASFSAAPALGQKLPYDVAKDFKVVGMLGLFPLVLNVNADLPVKTLAEFLAYCRERPGKLNYASAGVGGTNHIVFEMIAHATGIKLEHVPYRGAAPAATDLIGGQVHAMVDSLAASLGHIQGGKLRALALTTAARQPQVPDVPTLKEQGVDVVYPGWASFVVPAATPDAVVEALNAAINVALRNDTLVRRYREQVIEPVTWSVAATADFMAHDRRMLVELSKKTGIRLE